MSVLMPGLRVVVPDPTNYVHAHAFDEITLALLGGLKRLGFDVELTRRCEQGREQVLVLAPHLQPRELLYALDRDAILYTWEPRGWSHAAFMTDELTTLMREFIVWDYSANNVATWRAEGATRVVHVPLGYDPVLETLSPRGEADVDVLFYGSLNQRRQAVLTKLADRGVAVKWLFGVYGQERDEWITRSRVVLNMHAHDGQILELPRLAYLWASRIPVVAEVNPGTEDSMGMSDVMLTAHYDCLVEAVVDALTDPPRTYAAAQECHARFVGSPWMRDMLREAFRLTAEVSDA